MGRANTYVEGWKYTREGSKGHYFYPHPATNSHGGRAYPDRELSLCGYNYHRDHLDDLSVIRSKCKRCEKILAELVARVPKADEQ